MKTFQAIGLLVAGLIVTSVHLANLDTEVTASDIFSQGEQAVAQSDLNSQFKSIDMKPLDGDLPPVFAPSSRRPEVPSIEKGILLEEEDPAEVRLVDPQEWTEGDGVIEEYPEDEPEEEAAEEGESVPQRFRIVHCLSGLPVEAFEHPQLFLNSGSNRFLRLGSEAVDTLTQGFHLDDERNPHGFEFINEKFSRTVVIPQRSTIPGDRLMLSLSDEVTTWADRAFSFLQNADQECFAIRNVFSNMCLQPAALQSYADIVQEVCTGDRSQLFTLELI